MPINIYKNLFGMSPHWLKKIESCYKLINDSSVLPIQLRKKGDISAVGILSEFKYFDFLIQLTKDSYCSLLNVFVNPTVSKRVVNSAHLVVTFWINKRKLFWSISSKIKAVITNDFNFGFKLPSSQAFAKNP